ncbi:heme-dependent oxidative N-demethylase family protein [Thiosocius teredinicola]|uniref:heme-dependent oxidative N-demethylase family protein n=1 Tax=Thiosocius teredinicola TaxID=1973002 RepID=UPI000990C74F
MRLAPKAIQTFRDDFTYSNSPEAIQRFPFPFPEDEYRYSVNIEPHTPKEGPGSAYEHLFDIDEHYLSEMHERALVLKEMPERCLSMPHMDLAGWDMVERVMVSLTEDYPQHFTLTRNGDNWRWENKLLNIDDSFTFGNTGTLPLEPMEYIGRQMQGDFTLLDQREGDLYMDAGIITCPADWSLAFDAGMSFSEWHGPVPMAKDSTIFERALKYLTAIQVGKPVRRLNWTMTINARMDTSPETYHRWGHERTTVTPENVGEKVYLRVELQVLDRMPRSNALLFSIRTYLMSLEDIVTNPVWAKRLHRVMKTLPQALIDYKGLSRYHTTVVDYLAAFDKAN